MNRFNIIGKMVKLNTDEDNCTMILQTDEGNIELMIRRNVVTNDIQQGDVLVVEGCLMSDLNEPKCARLFVTNCIAFNKQAEAHRYKHTGQIELSGVIQSVEDGKIVVYDDEMVQVIATHIPSDYLPDAEMMLEPKQIARLKLSASYNEHLGGNVLTIKQMDIIMQQQITHNMEQSHG